MVVERGDEGFLGGGGADVDADVLLHDGLHRAPVRDEVGGQRARAAHVGVRAQPAQREQQQQQADGVRGEQRARAPSARARAEQAEQGDAHDGAAQAEEGVVRVHEPCVGWGLGLGLGLGRGRGFGGGS